MMYKNARLDLTTSVQNVVTCPANKVILGTLCQVTNIDGTNDVDITVQWTDSSDGNAVTELVRLGVLAAGDAVSPIAGGIVLEDGDSLQAFASNNGDARLSFSYTLLDV